MPHLLGEKRKFRGNLLIVHAAYFPILVNHWIGCAILNDSKEILLYMHILFERLNLIVFYVTCPMIPKSKRCGFSNSLLSLSLAIVIYKDEWLTWRNSSSLGLVGTPLVTTEFPYHAKNRRWGVQMARVDGLTAHVFASTMKISIAMKKIRHWYESRKTKIRGEQGMKRSQKRTRTSTKMRTRVWTKLFGIKLAHSSICAIL